MATQSIITFTQTSATAAWSVQAKRLSNLPPKPWHHQNNSQLSMHSTLNRPTPVIAIKGADHNNQKT